MVSLCQGDVTKINVDAVVNATSETLTSEGGIDGAIHEAAGPGLLHEYQKLNACETGDFKVTSGYKLPANYVFHTVRPRNKNEIKLKDCYKSCLQNVLTYYVKSIAFCIVAAGICGFDQVKAAEIALAPVRLWLESNHSSVDRVIFCTHENANYEICKYLMSTVYFPVSKIHLTLYYIKKSSNNDFVVNVKNFEISDEPGQNLSGWQIYPSTESPKESSKRISEKVDFNVVKDPNIPLGLINYGENVCFFNSVIQVLYCLPLFRDCMNKL